eukprot:CAMPEP_0173149108 /NCGR_PEP_ID=MMETSP1105-20130129/10130_1 /TAXON_ID=2985 /ORGANISM="Ochromonas sp., Strain BG-1" /LENGTH=271 /DNA_ID=CAMNT_0014063913 /DNA_START=103 /DNA_END=918 /DNA_ORIENTATION=+
MPQLFIGDNIIEWLNYFGFNADDQGFLLKEIEIQCVDDLNYVYDDEILLQQIRDHLSEESYSIFLMAREKTEGLLQVLKRRKEERALRESGVVRKNGANPDELLATRPAVRWEAVQPNIPDLSHRNNLIEKLTRRNVELENQLRISDTRFHAHDEQVHSLDDQLQTLHKQYQETKAELKKYKEQVKYLTKDVQHERQKNSQLYKDLQKVNKEKAMLDGKGNDCMICCDRIKNTVFLPCMHIAICNDCHQELSLTDCPICRVKIDDAKVVFW